MPYNKDLKENLFHIFFLKMYLKCNWSAQRTVDNNPRYISTLNGAHVKRSDCFSVVV